VLACAPPARAQELKPGAIVLLANSQETSAADTLRRALTDADPKVRRAAARVASVSHPEAFDTLRLALDTEQDHVVLNEFIRDVMALAGARALPFVEPAVQRAGGAAGIGPLAEWFARMQVADFVVRLPAWAAVPGASVPLASAVELAVSRHPDQRDQILTAWKPLAGAASWKQLTGRRPPSRVTMRTVPGLANEVLPETLAAANCKPGTDEMGSALVTFSDVGRPVRLEVDAVGLSEGCRTALTALARISLDSTDSDGQPQTLVVPMIPAFVACLADIGTGIDAKTVGDNPDVRSPRLKKEVKPSYTRRAFDAKIAGVVEMQAVVSTTGCVNSMDITRSLAPDLDVRAMIAALQWRFEPGTADGRPVPVIVNIELTFTPR
jgi:TonB family protein